MREAPEAAPLFASPEEGGGAVVVADALRLIQVRDELTAIKRARLQDAIDRGYGDITAGKVISLESEDQIDAFFSDL